MSKELEALNYLVNHAVVGNKEKHRGKIFESEEIVLEAIKRNEPMKVYSLPFNNGLSKDYRCRNCGSYLVSETPTNIRLVAKSIIFCKRCGRKLDWGNENE